MKRINVELKSEIFGYLWIIDSELFPVHGLSPKFFESICSLRKSRISRFLDSFIHTLIMKFFFFFPNDKLNRSRKKQLSVSFLKARSLVSPLSVPDGPKYTGLQSALKSCSKLWAKFIAKGNA